MNYDRRVVLTGMGTITPLGNELETFWSNLKNGVSGIRKIAAFDPSGYDCQIAGEVRDFDPKPFFRNARTFGGQIVSLNSRWPRRRGRWRTAESISKR